MDKAVRTTVYLTLENKELIRKLAYLKNTSKTAILNESINEVLKKEVERLENK